MARRSRAKSAPADGSSSAQELGHVVVVGGSLPEWAGFSAGDWESRLATLAAGVEPSGARWVTLMPRNGDPVDRPRVHAALADTPGVDPLPDSTTRLLRFVDPMTVIVDLESDGRRRFATAVAVLRARGVEGEALDEETLAAEVLRPSRTEPDLVVILGPPDRLPESLMWELAYSELVFLDIGWTALDSSHLEVAVEDFHRRNRRFGGLDS